MNCAEYKKQFSLYLDGQVSGAEMYALTRHMETCPNCTQEYVELRRTQQLLAGLSNALNAFMVPATAGALSAVLTFGLLFGFFAIPQQLEASSSDVPLMFYTGP